jgi:hypothetical protein
MMTSLPNASNFGRLETGRTRGEKISQSPESVSLRDARDDVKVRAVTVDDGERVVTFRSSNDRKEKFVARRGSHIILFICPSSS